jgi:hypothetical protein
MSDLESGLNYMLRHEIPRNQVIKGENLGILKTWLNVLAKVCILIYSLLSLISSSFVKYYPGRKQVHNFLIMLSMRIKSVKEEINVDEWKKIVDYESVSTEKQKFYSP